MTVEARGPGLPHALQHAQDRPVPPLKRHAERGRRLRAHVLLLLRTLACARSNTTRQTVLRQALRHDMHTLEVSDITQVSPPPPELITTACMAACPTSPVPIGASTTSPKQLSPSAHSQLCPSRLLTRKRRAWSMSKREGARSRRSVGRSPQFRGSAGGRRAAGGPRTAPGSPPSPRARPAGSGCAGPSQRPGVRGGASEDAYQPFELLQS